MRNTTKITGGIYLVVDPFLSQDYLLEKVAQAIDGGVDVLQVWNNWNDEQNKQELIHAICTIAHKKNVPVLVNEEWQLLQSTDLDGVHFDTIPADLPTIRQSIARPFITGLTCGNNLDAILWTTNNDLDYISFCSMFPSPSAGVCKIVKKETVIQARQLTSLPIFLAGGITLQNVAELNGAGINGIALISGIMKADDPQTTTAKFKTKLATLNNKENETNFGK